MSQFATTRWSLVVAAGQDAPEATAALETLCKLYWYPLYAYARRRLDTDSAQDATQGFFQSLLERPLFDTANPDRGRFRAYLLTAFKRFLANEHRAANALKRGGDRRQFSLDFADGESRLGDDAVDNETPERLFERQWTLTLLGHVLERLRCEFRERDRERQFDVLKQYLTGSGEPYAEAAERLGVSAGAAKVAAHRIKNRYREILRDEIAQTVSSPADVDEEIQRLFETLAR
ncbi:MAG: sigma-70 family RNA polymerase sigma factor [Pirellulaceae bacterium]|jgi:RNA polymerase sigma-70 factor (ECF subfamily)|nr:sigma-70 family RNA polymerase sigma factor [Pirellulaceae bacterium]MDP7020382.1 sigma-70 family RNA polymerase sigma factor [Pirellulaceae bacterium]